MGNVLCGLKKQTYSFDDINSNSSDHHGSVSQKPSAAEDLRIKSLSSSPRNIPLSPPTEQSHRVYATNAGVNNYPELCRTTPVKLAALNVIVDAADVMVRTADAMTRMANRHANAYRTFDDILLEGEISLTEKLARKINSNERRKNDLLVDIEQLSKQIEKYRGFQTLVAQSSQKSLTKIADKDSSALRRFAKQTEEKILPLLLEKQQKLDDKTQQLHHCENELATSHRQLMAANQRKSDAKSRLQCG